MKRIVRVREPMRPAVVLLILLAPLVFAGCTEKVDDAKEALAKAQQEAIEARDRYERVRSLAHVREERVTLALQPVLDDDSLAFHVTNATRSDGTTIAAANLTRLPLLTVETSDGYPFTCDPLTCRMLLRATDTLIVSFADAPARRTTLRANEPLPALTLENARVLATTAVGDATS